MTRARRRPRGMALATVLALAKRVLALAMVLALALATVLALALAFPAAARAAFEVRDATPAALGAASIDLPAEPFFSSAAGVAASASHAALYQAEGLTSERAAVALGGRALRASASFNQLGFPGAREQAARLDVAESGSRPIAISLAIERLALAIDGEPLRAGFALSGSIRSRLALSRGVLECVLTGDRMARTGALDELGVAASFPFAVRFRSGSLALGWMDRWEATGRASPRLVLDLALGRAACLRMARGLAPGRSGAAIAVRRGGIELAAGRMDQDSGGSVAGVSVALRADRSRGGP